MSTLPKTWEKRGWIDVCSDVNWENHGGLWAKKVGEEYYFVRYYGDEYESELGKTASLSLVSPKEVKESDLQSALSFTGHEKEESISGIEVAYSLHEYGIKAPLEDFTAKTPLIARSQAFKYAEQLLKSSKELNKRLNKVVNKIGSTAKDFMKGDSLAGLKRYTDKVVLSGKAPNEEKNLVLKIYGIDVKELTSNSNTKNK